MLQGFMLLLTAMLCKIHVKGSMAYEEISWHESFNRKKLPNKLSYGLEHPHLVVQHRTSIMMFFDHLGPSILGVEFKTVWLAEKKIKTAAVSFTKPTPIMSEHKSHLLAFSIHQSLNCTNTVKTHVKATTPPPPTPPCKPTNLWLQVGKDFSSI